MARLIETLALENQIEASNLPYMRGINRGPAMVAVLSAINIEAEYHHGSGSVVAEVSEPLRIELGLTEAVGFGDGRPARPYFERDHARPIWRVGPDIGRLLGWIDQHPQLYERWITALKAVPREPPAVRYYTR